MFYCLKNHYLTVFGDDSEVFVDPPALAKNSRFTRLDHSIAASKQPRKMKVIEIQQNIHQMKALSLQIKEP